MMAMSTRFVCATGFILGMGVGIIQPTFAAENDNSVIAEIKAVTTQPTTVKVDKDAPKETPVSDADRQLEHILNMNIEKFDADQKPLDQVIADLQKLTGMNIYINWESLETVEINKSDLINDFHIRNSTVSVLLDRLILAKHNMGYTEYKGFLVIGSREFVCSSKFLIVRAYDIRDLLDTAEIQPQIPREKDSKIYSSAGPAEPYHHFSPRGEEIGDCITNFVAPETWVANGGSIGNMYEINGELVVSQTPHNHQEIKVFLTQLRQSLTIPIVVNANLFLVDEKTLTEVKRILKTESASSVLMDNSDEKIMSLIHQNKENILLSSPQLKSFNDKSSTIEIKKKIPYVSDYDTQIGKGMYVPTTSFVETGLFFKVKSHASDDKKFVTVNFELNTTELLEFSEVSFDKDQSNSKGVIQMPHTVVHHIETAIRVPEGKKAVLGGEKVTVSVPDVKTGKSALREGYLLMIVNPQISGD